jgi:hypothetical protein
MQDKNSSSTIACLQPDQTGENVLRIEMKEVLRRLAEIQASVAVLLAQRTVKPWYSTAEVAQIIGKSDYTVREWCRQGRVHAQKKASGRGRHQAWVISQEELVRIEREGLLPTRQG